MKRGFWLSPSGLCQRTDNEWNALGRGWDTPTHGRTQTHPIVDRARLPSAMRSFSLTVAVDDRHR